MTARPPVKISKHRAQIVGVIASSADLQLAARMASPPDLFELRLDRLSIERRRELLMRFLPRARYVDLELRSAKSLRAVLDLARKKRIGRIISFHDFKNTPSVRAL